ncbi:response regulator [Luteibacter anthropi]|uniref:response regulator n=1 Tax=Luteibacter anthropi TaxID=564369 RepID=UPI0020328470|nr:response regulator [Luteibacter anthropi]URX63170.1 response regulator [Luteibacter anthropi]
MTHPSPLVVLLVEDDDTIRELTAMLLEGDGHTVHTAPNADVAEAWLQTGKADVLFTDVRMPGTMTGQELALRHSDMPVLVTSGEHKDQHPWLTGGMRYLAKPYDRKTLVAALREVTL